MGSKKNGKKIERFAKLRKFLNPEPVYMIYLDRIESEGRDPSVSCTCGWGYSSDKFIELGYEAKKHEKENPGHFRRHHA